MDLLAWGGLGAQTVELTIRFELRKIVPALVREMIPRDVHGSLWEIDATMHTVPVFVCHVVWLPALFGNCVDPVIRLWLCLSTLHRCSNDAVAPILIL